jgi:hypothetical protein
MGDRNRFLQKDTSEKLTGEVEVFNSGSLEKSRT